MERRIRCPIQYHSDFDCERKGHDERRDGFAGRLSSMRPSPTVSHGGLISAPRSMGIGGADPLRERRAGQGETCTTDYGLLSVQRQLV